MHDNRARFKSWFRTLTQSASASSRTHTKWRNHWISPNYKLQWSHLADIYMSVYTTTIWKRQPVSKLTIKIYNKANIILNYDDNMWIDIKTLLRHPQKQPEFNQHLVNFKEIETTHHLIPNQIATMNPWNLYQERYHWFKKWESKRKLTLTLIVEFSYYKLY